MFTVTYTLCGIRMILMGKIFSNISCSLFGHEETPRVEQNKVTKKFNTAHIINMMFKTR